MLGYATFFRPIRSSAILNFHSIRDIPATEAFTWTRSLTVTPAFLENLITELRRRNIAIVSLAEALSRLGRHDSGSFVAITLDDGYADNFHHAFPVFRQHHVPFTIFLTSGFIDRTMPMWWSVLEIIVRDYECLYLPHAKMPARTLAEKNAALIAGLRFFRGAKPAETMRLIEQMNVSYGGAPLAEALEKPLTWDMLKSMLRSGLATIGCHTANHPTFSRLDRGEIAGEISAGRDCVALELNVHPQFFAYPYGGDAEIGGEAPAIVGELGFEAAFTTRRAVLDSSDLKTPYLLPRITMSGHHQHRAALSTYFLLAEHSW